MTDRDDRYPTNGVQTFDHIIVVDVVGFVKYNYERILDGVTEELRDIFDGCISGKLLGDVGRMLVKCLAKDRTGTRAEASDMSVRDQGAFFETIECVACDHRFTDPAWPADQGIICG